MSVAGQAQQKSNTRERWDRQSIVGKKNASVKETDKLFSILENMGNTLALSKPMGK